MVFLILRDPAAIASRRCSLQALQPALLHADDDTLHHRIALRHHHAFSQAANSLWPPFLCFSSLSPYLLLPHSHLPQFLTAPAPATTRRLATPLVPISHCKDSTGQGSNGELRNIQTPWSRYRPVFDFLGLCRPTRGTRGPEVVDSLQC